MRFRLWRCGFLTMLFLSPCLLPAGGVLEEGGTLASVVAEEARAREPSIPWQSVSAAGSETSAGKRSVGPGMRMEAVRKLWGEPAEVRKVRTCFGAAEEWVYRGDPRRYGTDERILQFDEDGVLTEIK